MARSPSPSSRSRTQTPLRLADAAIVVPADESETSTRIDGATVATLLDVADDPNRLLDPEDIALELEHVADLLGALAECAEPPAAGALSVAERHVRHLASRVDALRPGARTHARRFVIVPSVREALRQYVVRWNQPRPAPDTEPVVALERLEPELVGVA